jgi:tripartite-type tricarboxylate transporter receptor subunit TctC
MFIGGTDTDRPARALSVLAAAILGVVACTPAATPSPTAAKPAATTAPGATTAPVATSAAAKPTAAAPTTAPTAAPAKPTAPAAPTAAAQPQVDPSLASVWAGKTITFIAGSTPGSGYDTWARLFARYMNKYLPGNPTTIVQNMAGAAHVVAANFVYEQKPDGLTVGVIDRGIIMKQVLKEEGIRYDVARLNFIGSPTTTTQAIAVHKRAGITRGEELVSRPVKVGLTDVGGQSHADVVILRDVLKWQMPVAFGFPGGPEVRLAIDRGDIDAFVNDWDTMVRDRGDDLQSGTLVPIIQIGPKLDDPLLKNVPTADELFAAKSTEDKQLLAMASRPLELGRLFVAPPGTDPKVLATMEAAFMQAAADPELLAEAERLKLTIAPVSGARMRQLATDLVQVPRAVIDRYDALLAADRS